MEVGTPRTDATDGKDARLMGGVIDLSGAEVGGGGTMLALGWCRAGHGWKVIFPEGTGTAWTSFLEES